MTLHHSTPPARTGRLGRTIGRIRFWWEASAESAELTRSPAWEAAYDEALVSLTPSPASLAHVFRRRPVRPHRVRSDAEPPESARSDPAQIDHE